MQQEIKLTKESSNTVFVDDVDVSKGVYSKNGNGVLMFFIVINKHVLTVSHYAQNFFKAADKNSGYPSLKAIINYWELLTYFTIPDNKRIVTERELTIDDLKSTDHVGFVDSFGKKGHVVCVNGNDGLFTPVTSDADNSYGYNSKNTFEEVKDAVMVENCCNTKTIKVYRFTQRTGEGSLYEWLNKK